MVKVAIIVVSELGAALDDNAGSLNRHSVCKTLSIPAVGGKTDTRKSNLDSPLAKHLAGYCVFPLYARI